MHLLVLLCMYVSYYYYYVWLTGVLSRYVITHVVSIDADFMEVHVYFCSAVVM